MSLIANVFVGLVALLHSYFLVLEMFLWDKPTGLRVFGMTPEKAALSKTLAANQGLYNGFLVAGLVWGLLRGAEGKSYGGLTLRFAPFKGETIITTPDGRTKDDLPIAHLPWADLSAQFADAKSPSGAAIFIAREHPDYPPEWLTRHYGVLCVGWPGVNEQTFPPGKPIHVRYRVWIHRGIPEVDQLKQAYEDFTRSKN